MVRNLVAASPYADDREIEWLKEIESHTYDDLGKSNSARFRLLDLQLAAALVKILPDQLRIRAQAKEMEAYKRNSTISGRQIAHMIYEWFKTDVHTSTLFSFNDLSALTWLGDKPENMEKFLQNWGHIMEHMQYTMPAECLRDLSYRQVQNSTVLKEDLSHYRREMRKGPGATDYTLTYLRKCVTDQIDFIRHEQNLQDRKIAFQRNQPQAIADSPAAAAAGDKGKGKSRGKSPREAHGSRPDAAIRGARDRSPSPTGSMSSAKSPPSSPNKGSPQNPAKKCYFYNAGLRGDTGCSTGDNCKFSHQRMTEDEFKQVKAPSRNSSSRGT